MISRNVLIDSNGRRCDKIIGLAVSLQIMIMAVKNILVSGNTFLSSINNVLNTILFFVVGAIYLWGFRCVSRRMKGLSIIILMASAILFCISALLFNENMPFVKELLPRTIVYSFIGFLYISSINDFEYLLDYMAKFSYVIICASVVSACMLMRSVGSGYLDSQYSMPLSYFTLIGVMFLLNKYTREEMKMDLLVIAAGILVIIAFGSRRYLLPIFSYIFVALVRRIRSDARTIKWVWLLLVIGLLVALNLDYVTNRLNDVFAGQGIHSRTLALLASGRIMDLTGRDRIHDIILNEFYKRPLTGIGIGGSYFLTGTHTHGMYMEIFTSLGLIVGSVVFVFLFYTIVKGFQASRGTVARELILIYACLAIPHGFVGGELWTDHDLWRLLGVCVSVIVNASQNVKRCRT